MGNLIKTRRVFTGGSGSGGGGGTVTSVNSGTDITVDNTDPANPIVNFTGTYQDPITVVANYSALPAVGTVTGQFYWCSASQGTSWLPGSLGGTYYSAGMYYSNGVSWEFMDVPYQATQAEVNTGTNTDKFVTPATLTSATSIVNGSGAANQITVWSGTKTQTGFSNITANTNGIGIGATADASTVLNISASNNGNISTLLTNTNNSTAAIAQYGLINDTSDVLLFRLLGSGYTTNGNLIGRRGVLACTGTQGTLLYNSTAATPIIFSIGGFAAANEVGRFTSTGLGLMGTSSTSSNIINTSVNTNSGIAYVLTNTNTSTAAAAAITLSNSTASTSLVMYGTGYTASGPFQPSSSVLSCGGANGLNLLAFNAAGTIGFFTGGTASSNERMRILSTGEVGIGITTPSTLLHVASNTTTGITIQSAAATPNPTLNLVSSRGTVSSPTATQSGDILGNFGAKGYGTSAFGFNTGVIAMIANQTFTNTANGTYIKFETTPDGSVTRAERWRIKDNGNLLAADGINFEFNTTTGTKIGTATSQKIGFWNVAPIVQPTTAIAAATFVANTSGTVNDTATFDGYTIGQVVKALRNAGLLA